MPWSEFVADMTALSMAMEEWARAETLMRQSRPTDRSHSVVLRARVQAADELLLAWRRLMRQPSETKGGDDAA